MCANWKISCLSSFSSGGGGEEVGGVRVTKERVGGYEKGRVGGKVRVPYGGQ